MSDVTVPQRALLSVYRKEGILPLAQALHQCGVQLIASGGTAQHLMQAGLSVTLVEDFAGSPSLLDGRVKTLHPKVYAGLLADRRSPHHLLQLQQSGYPLIDLLICNLYPFEQTVAAVQPEAAIIEMIDIGGPAMIRAAAKNFAGGCTVLVDPADYESTISAVRAGGLSRGLRAKLAARAFQMIADYDQAIARWFAFQQRGDKRSSSLSSERAALYPEHIGPFVRATKLRYGENPHQIGFLYQEQTPNGVAWGTQLCGKALSYTNLLDLDAAYRAVCEVEQVVQKPACVIIKHASLCGVAAAESQPQAFLNALSGDPLSAFGSVLGFATELTSDTARAIVSSKLFVECIVAPSVSEGARSVLAERVNLRLLTVPNSHPVMAQQLHRISGGLLLQESDEGVSLVSDWRTVSQRAVEPAWMIELQFAELCAKLLRSNAISISQNLTLIGAGSGQVSRIDAAYMALRKAGPRSRGAFLGSDAFFPFSDCVEAAAQAGVTAIIQPGGSIRDEESISACDHHGIAMVCTGRRHFRH